MAFLAFPIDHTHIPSSPSSRSSYTKQTSPTKQYTQEEMYGGTPRFSPSAEEDNVVLHEPWPMPSNVGPNHCQPGCSILIHTEEEEKVRKFGFLGRRRSRAGSFGSIRSLRSDGQSGGGVAGLIHDIKNPFSFGEGKPKVDEIKEEPEKVDDTRKEVEGEGTEVKEGEEARPEPPVRRCSLRFGDLPHRPPEMKRASSISLGVASRKMLLSEQNGSNSGGSSQAGGSGGPISPNETSAPAMPVQPVQPRRRSASPEPVDIGEVITSGVKSLWRNVRSSVSQSSTSPTQSTLRGQSSSPSRDLSQRRGSAPPSITSSTATQHGTVSTENPTGASSFGLPVVSEEPGSGAGTPLRRNGSVIMEEPAEYEGGAEAVPGGKASTGSEQVLAGDQPTGTPADKDSGISAEHSNVIPEDIKQPDTVRIDSSEQNPTLDPTLKHPDPTHRPPSPPPRLSDTEPLTPNTVSTGTSSPPPTTPLTATTAENDNDSISSDVEAFFDAEMKLDEPDLGLKPLSIPENSAVSTPSAPPGQKSKQRESRFQEEFGSEQKNMAGRGGIIRRASVDSGPSTNQAGRAGDRESAVLGFQRKMVDVGKKFNLGI